MYFVFPMLLRAIAMVGITTTAPTTQRVPATQPSPATQPAKVAPDVLVGKTYRSGVERECGLGPKGVVMGHWYLRFADSPRASSQHMLSWDHSDVRSAAAYKIAADGILFVYSQAPIKASYDPRNDRLLWDGLWYEGTK
jgi:hypothetical protein